VNKRDAQEAVHRLTARSLRALAKRHAQWKAMGIVVDTDHQAGKIEAAMVELADRLDAKFPQREPIDVTPKEGA